MTPKEKAIELVEKYERYLYDKYTQDEEWSKCVECALIAVDEILQSLGHKKLSDSPYTTLEARQYYVQVKQEIDAL